MPKIKVGTMTRTSLMGWLVVLQVGLVGILTTNAIMSEVNAHSETNLVSVTLGAHVATGGGGSLAYITDATEPRESALVSTSGGGSLSA